MIKSGIDLQALTDQFAHATAKQGEALRKTVSEATLKALQGRELTLENVRKVLKQVTEAASAGAAKSPLPAVDVEALLGKAIAGMDAALLQAVQAHRKALQQFVDQGIGMQEEQMKGALANIEKMEDVFFSAVGKAAKKADDSVQPAWTQALEALKLQGSSTGLQAATSLEELVAQAKTVMRDGRGASLRNAQTMMNSYAALVSGVLIGMSEGLQDKAPAKPAAGPTAKRASRARKG